MGFWEKDCRGEIPFLYIKSTCHQHDLSLMILTLVMGLYHSCSFHILPFESKLPIQPSSTLVWVWDLSTTCGRENYPVWEIVFSPIHLLFNHLFIPLQIRGQFILWVLIHDYIIYFGNHSFSYPHWVLFQAGISNPLTGPYPSVSWSLLHFLVYSVFNILF